MEQISSGTVSSSRTRRDNGGGAISFVGFDDTAGSIATGGAGGGVEAEMVVDTTAASWTSAPSSRQTPRGLLTHSTDGVSVVSSGGGGGSSGGFDAKDEVRLLPRQGSPRPVLESSLPLSFTSENSLLLHHQGGDSYVCQPGVRAMESKSLVMSAGATSSQAGNLSCATAAVVGEAERLSRGDANRGFVAEENEPLPMPLSSSRLKRDRSFTGSSRPDSRSSPGDATGCLSPAHQGISQTRRPNFATLKYSVGDAKRSGVAVAKASGQNSGNKTNTTKGSTGRIAVAHRSNLRLSITHSKKNSRGKNSASGGLRDGSGKSVASHSGVSAISVNSADALLGAVELPATMLLRSAVAVERQKAEDARSAGGGGAAGMNDNDDDVDDGGDGYDKTRNSAGKPASSAAELRKASNSVQRQRQQHRFYMRKHMQSVMQAKQSQSEMKEFEVVLRKIDEDATVARRKWRGKRRGGGPGPLMMGGPMNGPSKSALGDAGGGGGGAATDRALAAAVSSGDGVGFSASDEDISEDETTSEEDDAEFDAEDGEGGGGGGGGGKAPMSSQASIQRMRDHNARAWADLQRLKVEQPRARYTLGNELALSEARLRAQRTQRAVAATAPAEPVEEVDVGKLNQQQQQQIVDALALPNPTDTVTVLGLSTSDVFLRSNRAAVETKAPEGTAPARIKGNSSMDDISWNPMLDSVTKVNADGACGKICDSSSRNLVLSTEVVKPSVVKAAQPSLITGSIENAVVDIGTVVSQIVATSPSPPASERGVMGLIDEGLIKAGVDEHTLATVLPRLHKAAVTAAAAGGVGACGIFITPTQKLELLLHRGNGRSVYGIAQRRPEMSSEGSGSGRRRISNVHASTAEPSRNHTTGTALQPQKPNTQQQQLHPIQGSTSTAAALSSKKGTDGSTTGRRGSGAPTSPSHIPTRPQQHDSLPDIGKPKRVTFRGEKSTNGEEEGRPITTISGHEGRRASKSETERRGTFSSHPSSSSSAVEQQQQRCSDFSHKGHSSLCPLPGMPGFASKQNRGSIAAATATAAADVPSSHRKHHFKKASKGRTPLPVTYDVGERSAALLQEQVLSVRSRELALELSKAHDIERTCSLLRELQPLREQLLVRDVIHQYNTNDPSKWAMLYDTKKSHTEKRVRKSGAGVAFDKRGDVKEAEEYTRFVVADGAGDDEDVVRSSVSHTVEGGAGARAANRLSSETTVVNDKVSKGTNSVITTDPGTVGGSGSVSTRAQRISGRTATDGESADVLFDEDGRPPLSLNPAHSGARISTRSHSTVTGTSMAPTCQESGLTSVDVPSYYGGEPSEAAGAASVVEGEELADEAASSVAAAAVRPPALSAISPISNATATFGGGGAGVPPQTVTFAKVTVDLGEADPFNFVVEDEDEGEMSRQSSLEKEGGGGGGAAKQEMAKGRDRQKRVLAHPRLVLDSHRRVVFSEAMKLDEAQRRTVRLMYIEVLKDYSRGRILEATWPAVDAALEHAHTTICDRPQDQNFIGFQAIINDHFTLMQLVQWPVQEMLKHLGALFLVSPTQYKDWMASLYQRLGNSHDYEARFRAVDRTIKDKSIPDEAHVRLTLHLCRRLPLTESELPALSTAHTHSNADGSASGQGSGAAAMDGAKAAAAGGGGEEGGAVGAISSPSGGADLTMSASALSSPTSETKSASALQRLSSTVRNGGDPAEAVKTKPTSASHLAKLTWSEPEYAVRIKAERQIITSSAVPAGNAISASSDSAGGGIGMRDGGASAMERSGSGSGALSVAAAKRSVQFYEQTFKLHLYDAASSISLTLLRDGQPIAGGHFSVQRYGNGRKMQLWLPLKGVGCRKTELKLTVEVLV